MIAVVQRVARARVTVHRSVVAEIGAGVLALVAVLAEDDDEDVRYLSNRLLKLRVFADEAGRMNRSVEDVGGEILVVSQFTLAGETRRGLRPSFSGAASPADARRRLDALVGTLRESSVPVATGEFGATMEVELVNDGPVTLIVDTAERGRGRRDGERAQ